VAEQMLLPDDLIECARAHSGSERLRRSWRREKARFLLSRWFSEGLWH
jgi:hypothetical protein